MNNAVGVCLGLASFTGGCALASYVAYKHVQGVDNKFTYLAKGINYIQENIDMTVPEDVASELCKNAANVVATDIVKNASESIKKDIEAEVAKRVKDSVKTAREGIDKSIADKLEAQINVQTIEKIQERVSEKVAKQIISNYITPFNSNSNGTTKADIAKACIDSGMDGFDVARVMSSLK